MAISVVRLNSRLAATERNRADLEQTAKDLQNRLNAEQGNNKALADQLQQVQEQLKDIQQHESGGTSAIASLFLPFSSVRGAGHGHSVTLSQGTKSLVLKLDVGRFEFAAYKATVRTVSGATVSSVANLKPARTASGATVEVKVSAVGLKGGEYAVELDGMTSTRSTEYLGEYSFTVKRE